MADERRLIYLDHALQAVSENYRSDMPKYELDMLVATRKRLKSIPAVDAAPVAHGQWIKVADLCGIEVLKCSVCGKEHPRLPTAFCCDCGAKMDKGSESIG